MLKNDHLCTRESEIGEYDNKQVLQHLQGRIEPGVLRLAKQQRRFPMGVLNGAQSEAWSIVTTI